MPEAWCLLIHAEASRGCPGESLVPPYTRGSVSLTEVGATARCLLTHAEASLPVTGARAKAWCLCSHAGPLSVSLSLWHLMTWRRGEHYIRPRPYATAGGKTSRGLRAAASGASGHPKAAAPLRAKGRGGAVQTSAIFDQLKGSFGGISESLNGIMKGNPGEKTRGRYEAGCTGTHTPSGAKFLALNRLSIPYGPSRQPLKGACLG